MRKGELLKGELTPCFKNKHSQGVGIEYGVERDVKDFSFVAFIEEFPL